jgi:cathepsin D
VLMSNTQLAGRWGYYGRVDIGTPPTAFKLLLTTGGADLWVASTDCVSCPSELPKFNTSHSTTLTSTTSRANITFVGGYTEGPLVRDTVSMGGLSVVQHPFGMSLSPFSRR